MPSCDRGRSVFLSLSMAVCVAGCGDGGPAAASAGGAGGASLAGRDGADAAAGVGGASVAGAGGQLATAGAAGSAMGGAAAGGSAGQPAGTPGCDRAWAGDLQRGTPQDDEITSVTAAEGGGFYVTGYEGGDDESSDVIPAGDAKAIVARYDAAGLLTWETGIDTPGADTAEDLQVDAASGNLVVVGRTSGAFAGFQNAGQMDMYVMLMHSSGDALGAIQLGDDRPQHPVRVALGGAGQILVAGYDDIFIPSNYVAALPHGFVAALSVGPAPTFAPTLNYWHRSALFDSPPPPPSNADFTTGVAVDAADGAIYVTSTVNGNVNLRG
ncbi:MAG: hypothetical protein ACJ8F1_10365, partial [Polyangia bacterium]